MGKECSVGTSWIETRTTERAWWEQLFITYLFLLKMNPDSLASRNMKQKCKKSCPLKEANLFMRIKYKQERYFPFYRAFSRNLICIFFQRIDVT